MLRSLFVLAAVLAATERGVGGDRARDLRRRLLLVRRGRFRQGAGRRQHDLGLHRRQGRNPTYNQVSAGGTGHAEAVEIAYDPAKVSYQKLLDVFWHNHDPLAKDRQFCDSGDQYRPAIFYHDEEQRKLAEASKKAVQEKFAPRVVQTEIVKAGHVLQGRGLSPGLYEKNPVRYKFYRYNCGRDQRLEELWGKPDKSS